MPSKTRSVTREATNLITATPDHIAIKIAASLDSAVDLFHLSLAHRRLSLKKVAAPESESDEHPSPDRPAAESPGQETWSIANEGARQWVLARPLIQQAWLPPRENECWMERMNTVSLLAANPTFAHCDHLSLEISARHDVHGPFLGAVVSKNDRVDDEMFRTAKSGVVMRHGQHYAQFHSDYAMCQWGEMGDALFGVVRPDWKPTAVQQEACEDDQNCFYRTHGDGCRYPDRMSWEGMERCTEPSDEHIGLLLDLTLGSLTVYKNGKRLGIMFTGLTGEYCWAASISEPHDEVTIEPMPTLENGGVDPDEEEAEFDDEVSAHGRAGKPLDAPTQEQVTAAATWIDTNGRGAARLHFEADIESDDE
jgi:hypothetical protein